MALRVLATGPESSGTNYLRDLLAAGGADAVHRSQPEGIDWIDLAAMLDHPGSDRNGPTRPFDRAVVIIRGRLGHLRSQARRGIEPDETRAAERRRRALRRIAPILGDPRVVVVTYESLAEPAERRHLLEELGLDPAGADRCPWADENAKHY